jgi:hypothetical protein
MARNEQLAEEDGMIEVTRVWITAAGELVRTSQF